MAVRQTPLRGYQWGKESTRGTAVAATSPIFCNGINFKSRDELLRPQLARTFMMRNKGAETPVKRSTDFDVPAFPLSFDQLPHWLAMSVKGGVTPTGPADSAYTWTFNRAHNTNVTPDTWTLERELSTGSAVTDNEWAFALLREWTMQAVADGEVAFNAAGFARRIQASTFTPALVPVTGNVLIGGRAKLYIDDSVGALGSSVVSSQLLNWSLKFTSGCVPIWTHDNRSDLDFSQAPVNGDQAAFDFECTFLVDTQYAAEKLAAEAIDGSATGGLRALRLEVNHPLLIGTTSTRRLRVDMIARHEMGSVFEVGTQDGQDIVTVRYQESPSTAGSWISLEVINNVATLA